MWWQGLLQGKNMPSCTIFTLLHEAEKAHHQHSATFLVAVANQNGTFILSAVGGCIGQLGGMYTFSNEQQQRRHLDPVLIPVPLSTKLS